ncbi:MAG: DNA photolyase family protein, partial [Caulobacterales bacterium]|nr:DNA photolyase family protein [Caulobacterales bacterium]
MTSPDAPALLWLRHDLRLADHPALSAASAGGRAVVPVFILDDAAPGRWRMGGASRWWLHHSLAALGADLERLGSRLVLRRGATLPTLLALAAEAGAGELCVTRAYEPWAAALEGEVAEAGAAAGLRVRRFGGSLLFEPEAVATKSGEPFRVFTPFWRACQALDAPGPPRGRAKRLAAPSRWPASEPLESWELAPTAPDWAGGLRATWTPGEAGAQARLARFLDEAVAAYRGDRDRPDREGTSRLSPHLHFGEISPRRCWHAVRERMAREGASDGGEAFLRELGWREFSTSLIFHFPTLAEANFRAEFDAFPWRDDGEELEAWRRGRTGYPIVDAAMRELWETGWMHNRARMIAASFLIKHLLVDWREGEAWFWDTLVDADLANNAAGWQWTAGSGADAAPYFRIF